MKFSEVRLIHRAWDYNITIYIDTDSNISLNDVNSVHKFTPSEFKSIKDMIDKISSYVDIEPYDVIY